MCIQPRDQVSSQETPVPSPPSPPSPERTNTEPEPIHSEPQPNPPPESASVNSRKRSMPEPYSPEPNPKPDRHSASSSSTPPPPPTPQPPPSPSIPVGTTETLEEDYYKFFPMSLDELNRQSSSSSSTPPPPPSTATVINVRYGEGILKFLPSDLYVDPEPVTTILPHHDDQNLDNVGKDWTPPFSNDIDAEISFLADPTSDEELRDPPYIYGRESEPNLCRRRMSAPGSTSTSVSCVPVDHGGYIADVPIPTPNSRLVGAGIENLGNTCFLAAILQCLTHTVQMFLGLRHCDHNPCTVEGFCALCVFRKHNDLALQHSRNTIHPFEFVQNVNRFSPRLEPYKQEDAHEFLMGALNKLKERFPDDEQNNLISQVFGGQSISKLRCCSCGYSSDTFQTTLDLNLDIDNASTVERALESYIMKENMDGLFTCSSCKQQVNMDKQLMINKAPSVAILHLKRFRGDGRTYDKIEGSVYFTMNLDLEPYTTAEGRGNGTLKYNLYAIVVHSGPTANSGHYTSFVRSAEDQWHWMDDYKVFSVTEQYVLGQEAYILFYAKQDVDWFSRVVETEERDAKSKFIDNTQDCGTEEKDYKDLTEANDYDSTYANDYDSMYANDNDLVYAFNADSIDGNGKTVTDMEEEECDLADANDKDSNGADDNDFKVTDEKSVSGMVGEEGDLVDDDNDSKDADGNDSKDANEKSVSDMDGEECDLADANDKDSKGADGNDSKDANEKSVSDMDGEECDLEGANDNDSKDADGNDSKDANEKSVSDMDGEECDLEGANDNDTKDADGSESKGANEKSVSYMDGEECDLEGANDNDSKDADGSDSKDAKEKSVSDMDGEECDSKDADSSDSKDANEKSVSDMDGEECDSKDADSSDSKDANEKSVSDMDGEECDSKDADSSDSKDANEKSVSDMDGEECDSKDADGNDSKDANEKSVSDMDGEECDSKDADGNDSKEANEKSVSDMDGEECNLKGANDNDSKDADDNDSKVINETSVSGTDGEECDSKDANDDNDSKIANERFLSDMDQDLILECKTLHLGN